MNSRRFLLDTFSVQGLLNPRDNYHDRCVRFFPRFRAAQVVYVTEPVLLEIGNALSGVEHRIAAASFIRFCYETENITVPLDSVLLLRALALFEQRPDKQWSLTDCVSFVTMDDFGITDAATGDHHFRQAGYRPFLYEA